MSILRSIQTAEQNAEKLRSEAYQYVKEALEKGKVEASEQIQKLQDEVQAQEKTLHSQATKVIEKREKEILQTYAKQDQDAKSDAKDRKKLAIDFIMKKVASL